MKTINGEKFENIVLKTSHFAAYVSVFIILFLLLINFLDIVGTKVFNQPVMGIIEIIGFHIRCMINRFRCNKDQKTYYEDESRKN